MAKAARKPSAPVPERAAGSAPTRSYRPLPHRIREEELDPGPAADFSVVVEHDELEIDDAYEDLLRSNLALFARDVLGLEMPPHMIEWCEDITIHCRLARLAARDHGKSTIFSYAYPIWRAWSEPRCEIYLFSKTLDQAQEFLDTIIYGKNNLRGLVDIPSLDNLVPNLEDFRANPRVRLNRADVVLTNGSRIRAAGYGKAMRGRHPKYVVCDDVLNDEDMWSETVRKKNISYFQSAISNMVMPSTQHEDWFEGGQCLVVGTPYAVPDLYGYLAENKVYHFKKYPAIVRDKHGNDRALFPWRWSLAQLREKRRDIGAVAFSREILCCRPGTYVETSEGPRRIEDVRQGTLVLTHTGMWRPVRRAMRSRHDGDLVRVKGGLCVTPNHPVLTQEQWVSAGLLQYGDLVHHPRPAPRNEARARIRLTDGLRVPYLLTRDKKRIYARGSAVHLASGSVGRSGAKSVPKELAVDADLMRLFGLWLAEGHATDKHVVWSFGAHERETLAAEVVSVVRAKLGLEAKIWGDARRSSIQVVVGSCILSDFMRREFGSGAAQKRVPLWIRDLPPELLWQLVLGYVDGDGYVVGQSMQVGSVSERLLMDVRFLLARCGLFSTLRLMRRAKAGQIQGRPVNYRACWSLTCAGGSGAALAARRLPERSFLWGETRPSRMAYRGFVYNLEVEGDNSYVADGVAVHNCDPVSEDMRIFPSYLFPPLYDKHLQMRPSLELLRQRGITAYMGVDIARSANVGADYFVIFVQGKDANGTRYLLDIVRSKGLSFRRQLEQIALVSKQYEPALVYIESNAMQQIYTQEMRRLTDVPVKEFVTLATNKYPLDKGIPGLRILLENEKYVVPRGDEYSTERTDLWMSEAMSFGFVEGKLQGIGEHDDIIMAWWMAEEATKAGGFSFAFDGDGPGNDAFDTPEGEDDEDYRDVLLGTKEERGDNDASLFGE